MEKVCEICGNNYRVSKYIKTGQCLCSKHRHHMERFGFIKERTKFDPNEIVIYNNYAEIILYDKDCEEIARTLIDLEDVEKCKQYKWSYNKKENRVQTVINRKTIKLHQVIINYDSDKYITDHKDKNPLNNRRLNLRLCTVQQNNFNTSLASNNKTGVTGVIWDKGKSRWRAELMFNRKSFTKRFINKEDAIKQRLLWEKEYFGEFAPQRYLFDEYGI